MSKIKTINSGFTIIEFLVVFAITSILTIVLIGTIINFNKSLTTAHNMDRLDRTANLLFNTLTQEAHQSSSLKISVGDFTFHHIDDTTTKFYLQDGRIYRQQDLDPATPITPETITITDINAELLNSTIVGYNPPNPECYKFTLDLESAQAISDNNSIVISLRKYEF